MPQPSARGSSRMLVGVVGGLVLAAAVGAPCCGSARRNQAASPVTPTVAILRRRLTIRRRKAGPPPETQPASEKGTLRSAIAEPRLKWRDSTPNRPRQLQSAAATRAGEVCVPGSRRVAAAGRGRDYPSTPAAHSQTIRPRAPIASKRSTILIRDESRVGSPRRGVSSGEAGAPACAWHDVPRWRRPLSRGCDAGVREPEVTRLEPSA